MFFRNEGLHHKSLLSNLCSRLSPRNTLIYEPVCNTRGYYIWDATNVGLSQFTMKLGLTFLSQKRSSIKLHGCKRPKNMPIYERWCIISLKFSGVSYNKLQPRNLWCWTENFTLKWRKQLNAVRLQDHIIERFIDIVGLPLIRSLLFYYDNILNTKDSRSFM